MTEYTENYGKNICDEFREKVLERKINISGNESLNFRFNEPLDKLLSLVDEYFSQNTANEYPIGFYVQYSTNYFQGTYNGIEGRTSTLITNFGNIYRFYWNTGFRNLPENYKEIFKNFGYSHPNTINVYLEGVKINNTKLYNNEIDAIKRTSFFKQKTTSGPNSITRFYIYGAFCDKINANSDIDGFYKLIDNCIEYLQDIVLNHNLIEDKMNKIKTLEKETENIKFEKDETEQNNIIFLKENQNLKNTIELANNEKEQLVTDKKQLELDKNDLIEKISQYEEQNKKYNEKIVDLEGNIKVLEELKEKFRNEVESFKNMGILPRIFYK